MNITVTLTADPNLLAAIEKIGIALTGTSAAQSQVKPKRSTKVEAIAPVEETTEAKQESEPITTVVGMSSNPDFVEDPTGNRRFMPLAEKNSENLTKVTIEQLRAAVHAKAIEADGNRETLKNMLSEYGVKKITDLKEEHYAEYYKKVKEL